MDYLNVHLEKHFTRCQRITVLVLIEFMIVFLLDAVNVVIII